METAHKSEGGSGSATGAGAGAEGVLCHACGYQYPNGHPSAKQRRAHRKNCGKPASAAVVEDGAGEHDGSEMLLGEGSGGAGGDGNGAGATECGGGSPGSAPEAADAVEGGDSAGADPSGNGAGHQVVGDKSAEDSLISSSNILSEITPGDPSDPAVGSEPLQDVPTSVVSPEPEGSAKFSSEISESAILNSSSELTNDVVRRQDGVVAVTGEDGMINIIGESKSSEGKSVQADELDLSCQDILQTEIGGEHSSTVVDEDSGDKNPNASNNEEILSDGAEPNQQSKHAVTDSFEKVPDIEPVESSAEKFVGTDDDLLKLGNGGCHSEIPDDSKAQQQPDSTSEMADHLAISKGADNVEGQHYPTTVESIRAISSTFGAAVDAKIISVDATANLTEDVCSSGITMDDSIKENVASDTVVPSQVDLVDSSPSATAHEINMFDSANDVDEKRQNEKSSTDLASYEVKEMVIMDNFEEKQQNKEVIVDPTPHEADSFPSTDSHRENEHNEEIIADTTYKISAVQSMSSTEEKEQIEVFIANMASEVTNATSNRDMAEQQDETVVKTNHEIDRPQNLEAAGENNATADESNAGTITDDAEDKMPNEEITPDTIPFNITDSSINEEKMHNEVNEGLGSRDNIVVHGPDNVKEKKDGNTSADPVSHETTVAQTSESFDEEKNLEPAVDPISSVGIVGGVVNVQDKNRSEETTADPRSVENATTEGTEDTESSKQGENATTTDEAAVAQNTNFIEENEKVEDITSREISAIESADDPKGATGQNEEIADKEMVTDSDKNHVSLKVLLADKNVETKEKEKKASTKDRVLSFRRRVSKDHVSPVKPGSPTAGSGQQDWNSPARLPVEKKPKGRKQQWVPFICCSSVQ